MSASGDPGMRFSGRRLRALVVKECLQIVRDPSAILIAVVLPVVLLFLFAYAISLDIRHVRIGVVDESGGEASQSLAAAFSATTYFDVTPARDRRAVEERVFAGELRGLVVIPQDFDARLHTGGDLPLVQIITDGTQPNTADFVDNYARGTISAWQAGQAPGGTGAGEGSIDLVQRFWYNPEIDSRRALMPGALAIVMTIIGTILTALVVAREWERGTIEAVMSTPATVFEILLGKLIPYFLLGVIATIAASLLAIHLFDVPLRGSWGALLVLTAAFMVPALGQGLLISVLAKNQFVASQLALMAGFLPAFLLSGYLFEISSMPAPIRAFTVIIPARYFIRSLQTVYLAGDVWSVFIPDILAMLAIGSVLLAVARLNSRKSLDT
jgi:ABC-2 type transport system permease protein